MTDETTGPKRYPTFQPKDEENLRKIKIPYSSRNYQIKEIRRGIPTIVRPNRKPKLSISASSELRVTSLFVCQPKTNKRRNAFAWFFSCITVLVCFVFPMTSFVADVAFFVQCSDHYNDTRKLLDFARERSALYSKLTIENAASNSTLKVFKTHGHNLVDSAVHLTDRNKEKTISTTANSKLLNANRILPNGTRLTMRNLKPFSVPVPLHLSETTELNTVSSIPVGASTSTDAFHAEHKNILDTVISAHCYSTTNFPVCNSVSNILSYMTSEDASQKFREHKRVTSDVFEPVFILGSFPCLVFSIFTRLVIMMTRHDHFLSGYVLNMVCMPLQLVTGALAVHSASYHVGRNGFECWKCAAKGNCSNIDALSFMDDHVTETLIAATAAKFMDGLAGGFVLFVILLRKLWAKDSHVSCWWYFCRIGISLAAFIFCVVVSSSMVLTPSIGVFRLEMMEKTAYFQGKTFICYGSMVLLAMGLTAWGVSLLFLLIYLCFKTYVYCRRKEHLQGEYP